MSTPKLTPAQAAALREHVASEPPLPELDPDPEVNVDAFDASCDFDDWATAKLADRTEHVQVRGRDGWCIAPHKKTTRYQENVAIACGGFLVLPWGFRITTEHPTCPDCRAGRKRKDQ